MLPSSSWSIARVFAFGAAEGHELLDDFGEGVGFGAHGPGAGEAAEGAHTDFFGTEGFAGEELEAVVVEGGLGAAGEDLTVLGEVQRDDGDVFRVEVEPDVEFGPVGEGEDADGLAFAEAGVVEAPELWPLVFGIPLALRIAEAVDAFLGARFFFVAAGTAEGCVVASGLEGVEQGAGLEEAAAVLGSEGVGVGTVGDGLFVAVDDEVGADFASVGVAEGDHLGELVAGVDVEEGEGDLAGEEGLLGEAEHDAGVFADGVEHDRAGELGDSLAEDGDGFGFEAWRWVRVWGGARVSICSGSRSCWGMGPSVSSAWRRARAMDAGWDLIMRDDGGRGGSAKFR